MSIFSKLFHPKRTAAAPVYVPKAKQSIVKLKPSRTTPPRAFGHGGSLKRLIRKLQASRKE